jgi:hypothetical protein
MACNEILVQVTLLLYLYVILWKVVMSVFQHIERDMIVEVKTAIDQDVMLDL